MGRDKIRTVILCEDRPQAHFMEKLCKALNCAPVRVEIAPRGSGSAEQWVRMRYPREVKAHRRYPQERVGLVVVTDGDRFGVIQRKLDFAAGLSDTDQQPRGDDERIAICVPTWSIETWFAWFGGSGDVDETASCKQRAGVIKPSEAARMWFEDLRAEEGGQVPSLRDARLEMRRLGP